jgi:hypothetical protein
VSGRDRLDGTFLDEALPACKTIHASLRAYASLPGTLQGPSTVQNCHETYTKSIQLNSMLEPLSFPALRIKEVSTYFQVLLLTSSKAEILGNVFLHQVIVYYN